MGKQTPFASCYLCASTVVRQKHPRTRDRSDIQVLECEACGLVFLEQKNHVSQQFYEQSGMYGGNDPDQYSLALAEERDTKRRTSALKPFVSKKRYLDFGSGTGSVLAALKPYSALSEGVEPNRKLNVFCNEELGIKTYDSISTIKGTYDVISLFHVLEHLPDPCATLKTLGEHLAPGGLIYVEIPSANDALISLYDSNAFKDFTYWSPHLYLFAPQTLEAAVKRAGLRCDVIEQVQRYPLSNHLHWLARSKPGGHEAWSFLNSSILDEAYALTLARLGLCDTLVAQIRRHV